MLPGLLVVLIGILSVLVLLYQGLALYWARQMPRVDPESGATSDRRPTVSVVVVARNEERDLPECLDSLLAQEYPEFEILVVDGASTDRTREIALARGPRVRVLDEPPLPPHWVGKNWACHVGYQAARGSFLLFTDADVRYHPRAISTAVQWAEREAADLVSLAPRVEMVGFWERVVLPFYVQMVLTYFRAPRTNLGRSRAAMANGQFLLVRRAAYERVGGHVAVRDTILEDVRLAQEFKRAGLRLRIGWAPDVIVTRMYRDRREMFEGIVKNVYGVRFSAARQVGLLAGLIGFFWLPLGVLPLGVLDGSVALAVTGGVLTFALFAKHAIFTSVIGGEARYGLLFPIAVGFYVVLVAASLVDGSRKRPVTWKRRSYARNPLS